MFRTVSKRCVRMCTIRREQQEINKNKCRKTKLKYGEKVNFTKKIHKINEEYTHITFCYSLLIIQVHILMISWTPASSLYTSFIMGIIRHECDEFKIAFPFIYCSSHLFILSWFFFFISAESAFQNLIVMRFHKPTWQKCYVIIAVHAFILTGLAKHKKLVTINKPSFTAHNSFVHQICLKKKKTYFIC